MTQQNSTVNLLIHDAYGQPQMIKVVQGTPSKSFSHLVKTSISGQPTKTVFKTVTTQDNTQSVLTTASPSQVLRTIGVPAGKLGSSKFVQLQTVGQQKPIDEQTVQKIRLASSQVSQSGLRIVSQHQKISPQQSVINTNNSKTFISPILDHTGGGRKKHDLDNDYVQPEYSSKRRRTEKVGKGLRHFSMKVCEKVRKKGTTSYNEVADELVQEFTNPSNVTNSSAEQYDQKNIRRRVYDALNVLMAMNIISKEKKEIRWLGLPTNSLQECLQLEKEKQKKIESIKHKTQHLHDLIFQQISFKNLVERNRENQKVCGIPTSNSTIPLPFIIVSTDKKTCVECSISSSKMEYNFTFDNKFEVNDDIEVLKRIGMLMGLDDGTMNKADTKKAKSMLPKSLENYVEQLAQGCSDPIDEIMGYSEDSDAGPSSVCHPMVEIMDSGDGDQDMSRHSSYSDPLSPNAQEFSDEEQEWDESDVDIN